MLRHIEDAADVEGSIGLVVQDVAGLVVSLRYEAVELLVLPLTNVLGVQHPECLWRSREMRSHQLSIPAVSQLQGSPFRVTLSHWSTETRSFKQTALHSPSITVQARYHRLTKYCPSADLGSPPTEVLLPCDIYKAALFSPEQKGFG